MPPSAKISHFGDYVPRGWEKFGDDIFVDTSGFGAPGEPALTMGQFAHAIGRDPEGTGSAITQAGQFQAYGSRYRKRKTMVGCDDVDVWGNAINPERVS
jgi:hypothetical protein